jgi:hypothetical protein
MEVRRRRCIEKYLRNGYPIIIGAGSFFGPKNNGYTISKFERR